MDPVFPGRLDPKSFDILPNPNPLPYLHKKNLEQNIYDLFLHKLTKTWKSLDEMS